MQLFTSTNVLLTLTVVVCLYGVKSDGDSEKLDVTVRLCRGKRCLGESNEKKESLLNKIEDELRFLLKDENCDRVLTDTDGDVTSPDWPRKSTKYLTCNFEIVVDDDRRLLLTFDDFQLIGDGNCTNGNNFVEITDVVFSHTERICGSSEGFTWTSEGNRVHLTFQAESEDRFHLFHAFYKSIETQGCEETFFLRAFGMFFFSNPSSGDVTNTSTEIPPVGEIQVDGSPPSRCNILIHSTPGNRISVTFEVIDIHCSFPLVIHDPLTELATSICNSHEDVSWTSTGNEVIIQYSPNSTFELDLEFEVLTFPESSQISCNSFLRSSSGSFTSPEVSPFYPIDVECWTLIHATFSEIIQILFESFSVGDDETNDCEEDYLQIKDLTTDRVDRICGLQYPFTWTSDSNEVLITLKWKHQTSHTGFEASYSTLERFHTQDCLAYADMFTHEQLSSKDHDGGGYRPNQECVQLLRASPGHFFILEFLSFYTEGSDPCHQDFLEITDVAKRDEVFCGDLPPFLWTSTGNEVLLRFITDETIAKEGFQLAYKRELLPEKRFPGKECRFFYDQSEAEIIHPEPDASGQPDNCLYVLHGPPGSHVTVTFKEFSIDENVIDDLKSTIQISDPSIVPNSPSIHNFTSGQPPFTWTSKHNELHISVTRLVGLEDVRFNVEYKINHFKDRETTYHFLEGNSGNHSWADFCNTTTLNCLLLIHGLPNERILLRFAFLNFTDPDCDSNSLQVTDILGRRTTHYCSNFGPFSLVSSGNEVILHFRRSAIIQKIFMKFSYVKMARPENEDLHLFLTDSKGAFSSIASPSESETSRQNASALIQVKAGDRIVLKFKHTGSQNSGKVIGQLIEEHCENGIKIHDLTSNTEEVICREGEDFSWTCQSNAILVSFNISRSVLTEGFRASYTSEPKYEGEFLLVTDNAGSVVSPGYPGNYSSLIRRQWLIRSQPGDIISAIFNMFDIQESVDCEKDFVWIKDQLTERQRILCGRQDFVWSSEGNELLITFESDEKTGSKGFSLSYEIIPNRFIGDCFYRLKSESGEFNFDANERDMVTSQEDGGTFCQFLLETTLQKRIRLKISQLTLTDCNIAELVVVDMGTFRRREICQLEHTFAWTSDFNGMFLHLQSTQQELPTMTLEWETVDRSVPDDCITVVTDENSTLLIMDIPSIRQQPSSCQIIVNFKPDRRVMLSFESFQIMSSNCSSYIKIKDSVSGRWDKLCDVQFPSYSWISDGNEVLITVVQSQSSNILQTSKIAFSASARPSSPSLIEHCSKTLTQDSGVLESLNFPGQYFPNQMCSALIHTSPGRIIRVTMQEFFLENDTDCEKADFLKISDISSSRTSTICGHLHPFSWTSSGNELFLTFRSDSSISFEGYRGLFQTMVANQEVQDCNVTLTGDSGTIELPRNHAWFHTLSTIDCHYLIQTHPTKKIIVMFEEVSLNSNENCDDTFGLITDVTTRTSSTLCGNFPPFEWTSVANEVELTFHTDDTSSNPVLVVSYSVELRVPPSSCDKTFTSMDSNIISTSGFEDRGYSNNQDCTYTIQANENQVIEVTFDTFDLEDSEMCKYDYVELKTNTVENAGRFCGVKTTFNWLSDSNFVKIVFHSDHVITRQGFTAHYSFLSVESKPVTDCNETLTLPRGNFSSPGYPDNYGNNQECTFSITGEANSIIFITFYQFHLEEEENCQFDYVEMRSPTGRPSRYCGYQDSFNWTAPSNQVTVTFHSDGSVVFGGFTATYSSIAPLPIDLTQPEGPLHLPLCFQRGGHAGYFSSPYFPDSYPHNQNCRIDFESGIGTTVGINLFFLDLEKHPSCSFDYIIFYDVISGRSSSRLCGKRMEPMLWESDSNHVLVVFHSDEIVSNSGFYGFFTVIPA